MGTLYARMPEGQTFEFRHPDGTTRQLVAITRPSRGPAEYRFADGTSERIPGSDMACAVYHSICAIEEDAIEAKRRTRIAMLSPYNAFEAMLDGTPDDEVREYVLHGDFLKDLAEELKESTNAS